MCWSMRDREVRPLKFHPTTHEIHSGEVLMVALEIFGDGLDPEGGGGRRGVGVRGGGGR